ncbi:hypothetical protein U1Q18_002015 [Sarracenia purpurea var. burkii]
MGEVPLWDELSKGDWHIWKLPGLLQGRGEPRHLGRFGRSRRGRHWLHHAERSRFPTTSSADGYCVNPRTKPEDERQNQSSRVLNLQMEHGKKTTDEWVVGEDWLDWRKLKRRKKFLEGESENRELRRVLCRVLFQVAGNYAMFEDRGGQPVQTAVCPWLQADFTALCV